jgi:hypothetical protein
LLKPLLQTFKQLRRVRPSEYPAERVFIGYAVGQFQKFPEPLPPCFAQAFHPVKVFPPYGD